MRLGPGYTVMLMILSRASLVVFCGDYWLIGCAGAYFVLGVALGHDIVNYRLKIMNHMKSAPLRFEMLSESRTTILPLLQNSYFQCYLLNSSFCFSLQYS